MANTKLNNAKSAKLDEFYTQISDIENEVKHYKEHFKGKTVLCNCDDPRVSNFFKYFTLKFRELGLKKLIATCYKNQDIDLFSQKDSEHAVYIIYEGTPEIDHIPTVDEIEVNYLKGDGDFRSEECIEILKEADIVVTNPPFSLFREYVAQLVKYGKKFLILGNKNALTYADLFPLIKENKLWIGVTPMSREIYFNVPQPYIDEALAKNKDRTIVKRDGKYVARSPSIWFTNLDHRKRHEKLPLYKKYSPDVFPKYDNYDAIEVAKTPDIPYDYDGVIGVPITFMDKYNPEQFEIVGVANHGKDSIYDLFAPKIGGKQIFKRILIRRRKPQ